MKDKITTKEVFAEVCKYSESQCQEFIKDLETDVKTLSQSMVNLYDEHAGVFLAFGVKLEVKFSVFNADVFTQRVGNPEVFTQLRETFEEFKEGNNDKRA